eukprot:TRINITY_DN8053_c0_g2_i1.p2 TRINITY_DN8053_c0_g2~~TRINITY_DN8053_c0_g2_i1.p2  ORF type:complete len:318 (+),score=109.00 TRINITY_DN8053_c0_g2_i1:823-1776(+)
MKTLIVVAFLLATVAVALDLSSLSASSLSRVANKVWDDAKTSFESVKDIALENNPLKYIPDVNSLGLIWMEENAESLESVNAVISSEVEDIHRQMVETYESVEFLLNSGDENQELNVFFKNLSKELAHRYSKEHLIRAVNAADQIAENPSLRFAKKVTCKVLSKSTSTMMKMLPMGSFVGSGFGKVVAKSLWNNHLENRARVAYKRITAHIKELVCAGLELEMECMNIANLEPLENEEFLQILQSATQSDSLKQLSAHKHGHVVLGWVVKLLDGSVDKDSPYHDLVRNLKTVSQSTESAAAVDDGLEEEDEDEFNES